MWIVACLKDGPGVAAFWGKPNLAGPVDDDGWSCWSTMCDPVLRFGRPERGVNATEPRSSVKLRLWLRVGDGVGGVVGIEMMDMTAVSAEAELGDV